MAHSRIILLFAVLACVALTSEAVRVPVHVRETLRRIQAGTGAFRAGVAKVNATMPTGVPLAGYNHGDRRVKDWPIPDVKKYTTFMTPSVGHLDPTWAKALIIEDPSGMNFCMITLDTIGAGGSQLQLAWNMAAAQGFNIPLERVTLHASHSHSGPGALTPDFLWAMAPAMDLMVPELQTLMCTAIANAMLKAQAALAPAKFGITMGNLVGATKNRRAKESPYVNSGTIDPHLPVIRVDDMTDKPLATVWNFAIHGVCYGPNNMQSSADIMGEANRLIEESIGGVSMFINADAGDIDPCDGCCNSPPSFNGSHIMSQKVLETRAAINTSTTDIALATQSNVVPFGPTDLNITLSRWGNCTKGGFLDICSICAILRCDLNAHLPSSWIEENPRFTALRIDSGGKKWAMVTVPGEPLVELGWQIRNDSLALGYDYTLLAGYSNNHMGYFATGNEYDIGGYESELTMWGYDTAERIRNAVKSQSQPISPSGENKQKKLR
eukprot:TRINITY_DN28234_c0_g1_i1.p1 TRINITY_DN28234_c0_g1~~TRINITY_DN28234_c0_g1_i1.p1  ORF type:complete len:506 (+),score=121.43 TRINITY_DN28234_c0_g1_i1:33-1520(+)